MKTKSKIKRVLAGIMAASMAMSLIPTISFAAQSNEYVDPADTWIESNGRTNELDVNATITYETTYCPVCDMETTQLTYRVPEYTKSGETALNHGVMYSDGTLIGGTGSGNTDSGTPGIDAYYTGYHFTKSVCQNCGVINSVDGTGSYSFGKNVYTLNPCDHNFFLDFDNTTYTPYDSHYHTTVLKKGEYCQFCKGTYARATEQLDEHNFDETVDGELGNQRFHITADCEDCGYIKNEYIAAKSVIQSYYGKADGKAHTVTVSDLSESGVHTSIRYGTSADKCNLTSAPNYTDEGYYPVYYEIDYSYGGESMTENGVSYVWLLADNTNVNTNSVHTHDFRFLETVRPTCTELGYDRFQCVECGALQKTNYVPATGHDYETVVIREASCQQGGLVLHMCKDCGDFYTDTTSMTSHTYVTNVVPATCTMNGYTEHICIDCGYKYITDLTPLAKHDYREKVTAPTCTARGYTTYTCADCGDIYISDYTEPLGHEWDEGHTVTSSTCESEGVIEYNCKRCDETMIAAISATGHTPSADATCTEPQICTVCGAILELPTGHNYTSEVTAPTCTSFGYTTYTCTEGDHTYIADYTDKTEHNYNAVVTAPTCTSMGYTTYTCVDCGDTYVSDYTDRIPHDYEAVITEPTCTEMGYTTYTCKDCGDTYVSDYTEELPHNYGRTDIAPTCTELGYSIYTCLDCGTEYIGDYKEVTKHNYVGVVTEPTCTEMGYTTYTCTDCGETYIGDYADALGHDYIETITAPTCTEMGFSTFTCSRCGDSHIGNETDKLPHNYEKTVTEPTCTELGYTTYTCTDCGETHKSDYIEASGHKPSEWIIDVPATIENSGSKHIECTVCGTILETAEIEQLTDKDNSDEDGHSKVGDYSILITDKNNKPIFNSEISIDTNDNITIKLPDGRLLSADDITTITVIFSDTKQAAEGINIFIADYMNNAATGTTDENGQLRVPNTQSSTGDTNGTVADNENTYVVVVTDKNGVLIPGCDVTVGENYSINVNLPNGTAFDADNRITITVVTEKGEPVTKLRVQLIGDGDFVENGYTNVNGQITLPMSNTDITDGNGNGEVGEIDGDKIYDYIVTVSDENGFIENALITLVTDDSAVLVCLPEGSVIDYYNRITVKVVKSDGTAVEGWKVTVYNKDGSGIRTEVTDENGIVIVPPLSEAPIANPTPTPDPDTEATPLPGVTSSPAPTDKPSETDKPIETEAPNEPDATPDIGNGSVVENKEYKYRVYVWDNNGAITEFGLVKLLDNGNLEIELPSSKTLNPENKVYIKVISEDNSEPVKGITVNVTDSTGASASDITNSDGIAVVPVSDTDITDMNGNAQVKDEDGNLYNVNVETEVNGNIEGAVVKVADGKITVTLPDGTVIDYSDRTTVTVTDRDNEPVAGIPVNVKDNNGGDRTENTDENGKVVVPPRNEYITDENGDTGEISVPTATPNPDATDDPNSTPEPTEKPVTKLNVKVEDESGVIENAIVVRGDDNEITVKLPDGKTLDKDNRITVTVTDQDNEPIKGLSVTVTDSKGGSDSDTTNTAGIVIVPITDTDTTDDNGGMIKDETAQYTVTVENKDGVINNAVIVISDGKISVTLPDDYTLTTSNQTTVTVLDKDGNPVPGVSVTVTDKNSKTATKTTDANGKITVPVATSSGSSSSGGSSGGGGGSSSSVSATNVKVVDKDGKNVSVTKSTTNDGITLTLPSGTALDGTNYYTITVTDSKGSAKADYSVTLKDKNGNTVSGTTDKNGQLILPPVSEHELYIVGYEDGEFKPENNMTRAEAAAIFARNISERKGENISGSKSSFTDVSSSLWYANYVAYLEKYDIIVGYDDGTFKPEEHITRAEFLTMCVRFYSLFDKVSSGNSNKFTDVSSSHWAYKFINNATAMDWIKGYADGTFKPDNNITRAEVVAIVNRVTDREADTEYVNKNLSSLNHFRDLMDKTYWAYYDIIEAANTHTAFDDSDGEIWVE